MANEEIISTRTTVGTISIVKVRTTDLNPYRIAVNGEIVSKIGSEIIESDSEGRHLKAVLTFTAPNGETVRVTGGYTDEALIECYKQVI